MKSYTEIKQALRRETSDSLRYFTKSFLATYTAALEENKRNAEKGIDDSWDAVRKTDFYQKSGSAYCVFLQIVA